jgi:putative hydrolase of the HAD superfamily
MESEMTIRAVLFDYGLVLSGPQDEAAKLKMQMLLDTDATTFAGAYWEFRDAYDRGALDATRYWHAVAGRLQRVLDSETLKGLMEADVAQWTQPNEPMIAWAKELQRTGVLTGILSNLGDAMETGVVGHFPWLNEFLHLTFSHRLGIAKPDEAIYHHAAEGLGVKPQEVLFIDDRAENVEGARRAGMMAIQYGNHAEFVEEMRKVGLDALMSGGGRDRGGKDS